MEREKLLVGVWKDKLTRNESVTAARELVRLTQGKSYPFNIGVAPNPFSFAAVAEILEGTPIKISSQNVLWNAESGSAIEAGAEIEVEAVNGMTLKIRPVQT